MFHSERGLDSFNKVISGMKTTFYTLCIESKYVQITNWNIIKQNEYSLFLSIPADGSIPAVTYIYIPRVSNAFGDLENYRKLSQLILIEVLRVVCPNFGHPTLTSIFIR